MPAQSLAQNWQDWKESLDLSARRAPELYGEAAGDIGDTHAGLSVRPPGWRELYEDASEVGDTCYAGPLRTTLRDLGASAVFCVQGVPTAVFFAVEDEDAERIARLHSDLWNQGLASVLVVVCGHAIRIYSLAGFPANQDSRAFDEQCLVQTLDRVRDALEVRNLIRGIESGRYWRENEGKFNFEKRVDSVLLKNLKEADNRLRKTDLKQEESQALLMQTMFIAYLEDRGIITDGYIEEATKGAFPTFSEILASKKVTAFNDLFRALNRDFNGDLFVKPCSFGESGPRLQRSHLEVLAPFHSGKEEMHGAGGQLRLWGYDFEYIPVELISAVYDRFLNVRKQASWGQFHTPMYVATSVVSQLWDDPAFLTRKTKDHGRILDPACGSGIFLVCMFKRLCEWWRQSEGSEEIPWRRLRRLLDRLHGWDVDASAVRVAVFSLYVALLEEVDPPDIRKLMNRGRLLPGLWGDKLHSTDFFRVNSSYRYDVIMGNPPWRSGDDSAADWCRQNGRPAPDKQAAWGFVWKSLEHLKKDGKVAFLLPAKGFLHNHSKTSIEARENLLTSARIGRIVNYADLRYQLFDNAIQPASLFIFGRGDGAARYVFDYWTPKADPNLRTRRVIGISADEKMRLDTAMAVQDPHIFKKRLWMTSPENKLFRYLTNLPALRSRVIEFKHCRSKRPSNQWIIGQGFIPVAEKRSGDPKYQTRTSQVVGSLPFLNADNFRVISPDVTALQSPRDGTVYRGGFKKGFCGPRVLITQGTAPSRLRASYTEESFCFQDAIQAIVVGEQEQAEAKLLTAVLNSTLTFWFAFHGTSSIGVERPKVHQEQLLDLPFPSPEDLPDRERAFAASKDLTALVDVAAEKLSNPILAPNVLPHLLSEIDRLVFEFFCLSEQEVMLVEDTIKYIVPAIQPRRSTFPAIWQPTGEDDRREYARVLVPAVSGWMNPDKRASAALVARNDDLAILRLRQISPGREAGYVEETDNQVGDVLAEISSAIGGELPGNLQQMPDLRVYADDDMYLVKPNRKRFWMRSCALADAERIAIDLRH